MGMGIIIGSVGTALILCICALSFYLIKKRRTSKRSTKKESRTDGYTGGYNNGVSISMAEASSNDIS